MDAEGMGIPSRMVSAPTGRGWKHRWFGLARFVFLSLTMLSPAALAADERCPESCGPLAWGAHCETAAHRAARRGDLDELKRLAKLGESIDAPSRYGIRPLHEAVDGDHAETVEWLVLSGADRSRPDRNGESPLFRAVLFRRSMSTVAALFAGAVDGRMVDEASVAAAVRFGRLDVAEFLLHKVGPERERWPVIVTGAEYAIHTFQLNLLSLAIGWLGPERRFVSTESGTLLHAAARADPRLLRRFLAEGAEVDAVAPRSGKTPLFRAAGFDVGESVRLLLQHGASVTIRDHDGRTPLHSGAYAGSTAVVGMLLEAGGDVNARNRWGRVPLHIAAGSWGDEVIDQLLGAGTPVDVRDGKGATPLQLAL